MDRDASVRATKITVADLCILVAGCAVALASVKYRTDFELALTSSGPIWYAVKTGELFEKVAVALLIVILSRRTRLGGPLRPAEWLLIAITARSACSLRLFNDIPEELSYRLFGNPEDVRGWWVWAALGSVLLLLSLHVLIRHGRTFPRVATLILACFVMLTAFWGPSELVVLITRFFWRRSFTFPSYNSYIRYGWTVFSRLLERLLIGVPLLVTLRLKKPSDRVNLDILQRAGIVVSILIIFNELVLRLYPWPLRGSLSAATPRFASWAIGWMLALVLAKLILICFGPAIRRRLDLVTGGDPPKPSTMFEHTTFIDESLSTS
jgi:hypothetical protein